MAMVRGHGERYLYCADYGGCLKEVAVKEWSACQCEEGCMPRVARPEVDDEFSGLSGESTLAGVEKRGAGTEGGIGEPEKRGSGEEEQTTIEERSDETEEMKRKVCKACGVEKDLDPDFTKTSNTNDGHAGRCKQCKKERRKIPKRGRTEKPKRGPGKTRKASEGKGPRKCRVCGCTDNDSRQCIAKIGGSCYWVEKDLCSACVGVKPRRRGTKKQLVCALGAAGVPAFTALDALYILPPICEQAEKNVAKWGLQDLTTLGLVAAKEAGQLVTGILYFRTVAPQGEQEKDRERILKEAVHLGALCVQVIARVRRDQGAESPERRA